MIGLRSPFPPSRRQDGARDVCPAVAVTRAEDRRGRSGNVPGQAGVDRTRTSHLARLELALAS